MDFTKGEIFQKFADLYTLPSHNDIILSIFEYMETKMGKKIKPFGRNSLTNKLNYWLKTFIKEYKACYFKLDRLETKFARSWNVPLIFVQKNFYDSSQSDKVSTSTAIGRPRKSVNELENSSLYNLAYNVALGTEYNIWILLRACEISASLKNNKYLEEILKKIRINLEDVEQYFLEKMNNKTEVIKMDADEALGFLLDNSLSKNCYNSMRLEAKDRNADIFPSYNAVRIAKENCRPEKASHIFTDSKASTTVKALTYHTTERIITLNEEILSSITNDEKSTVIEGEIIFGGDGSTGHSMYHQFSSEGKTIADNSLFCTSLTPLLFQTKDKNIIWKNKTPQSFRFNRPISLEFVKETKTHVLDTFKDLREQIKKIEDEPGIFHFGEVPVIISFKFYPTLIDGKILNILTGTGSQTCPFCKATPNDFNVLENLKNKKFDSVSDVMEFGCQPLHAIINTFNGLLHISYKKEINVWRAKKSQKEHLDERKKKILQSLECAFGIKFDIPRSGGAGTSTTGKLCRIAFDNPETFAAALELDVDLITNLSIILKVLNAQEEIDCDKFDKFCKETYEMMISLYSWYKMPATIHKILYHSAHVAMVLPLSIGSFGEEGAENHNFHHKQARLWHARKTSRKDNLQDVFQRAMDASDPLLSSKRLYVRSQRRRNRVLSEEVRNFFKNTAPDVFEEQQVGDSLFFGEHVDEILDNFRFEIDLEECS